MKFHIVSSRENIKKIAFLYNMDIEEIQKENRHIRDWVNLVPGTKLKIPVLSEALINEVNEFEPFIEDYYPKYDLNEKIDQNEIDTDESINVEVNASEYVSNVKSEENSEQSKEEINEQEEVKEVKEIEKKEEVIRNEEIKDLNNYQRRYYMIPPYPYANPIVYPPLIYVIRRNGY